MKIAQLVSNVRKVSPRTNSAIYSHVAWLTNGLVGLGHNVDVFASGDSVTNGKLHSVTSTAIKNADISDESKKYYVHLLISQCYEYAKNVDIVHSHFNLLSSFYSNLSNVPTVQSIHSPIAENVKPLLMEYKNNKYISFSLAQRKALPELNWIANIYHGVDMNVFSFNPEPKDYFLFLGRITRDKGVHIAIEAAKAANVPLIIVGRSYPAESYWHDEIEKHIDGKMVRYVGEADFEKKIEWIRNAKALLFPTQYDEVFGYVMIEAMACGTPVIGLRVGSVPEVVAHERTGYVVESVSDMVQAIKKIDNISREETRARAEKYFSVEKMVHGYEHVYARVIEEHKKK
ncbi:MAG: glycosyltransferase family 4 protein [Candidatus Azambacteria bacterium]|nr:glycosyltransferase family 4 protein [Candidatus Azambacteria bacterium]